MQSTAILLGYFFFSLVSILRYRGVSAWTTVAVNARHHTTTTTELQSTTTRTTAPSTTTSQQQSRSVRVVRPPSTTEKLSGQEIVRRREAQLKKMRLKDAKSPLLSKEQLNIVYEDKHIIVVDKPAGVLSVSPKHGAHSLAEAVAAACLEDRDAKRMVVHRLGMDTSGLIIFAKTDAAVRGMHTVFRVRKIQRTYEALVCGHMEADKGMIDLPLMMDYEHPPFMRISTDEHQENLLGLEVEEVGRKILQGPKESITRYEVIAREQLNGEPVTRIQLTSVSGRTHQLNCHLATLGHPIVGDKIYSVDGEAAPNGGLRDYELEYLAPNASRASEDTQRKLSQVDQVCCHAKGLRFLHPVKRGKVVNLSSPSPF